MKSIKILGIPSAVTVIVFVAKNGGNLHRSEWIWLPKGGDLHICLAPCLSVKFWKRPSKYSMISNEFTLFFFLTFPRVVNVNIFDLEEIPVVRPIHS